MAVKRLSFTVRERAEGVLRMCCEKMKNIITFDMKTYNPVVHRRFGKTYCLHLQDRRVSQASSLKQAASAFITTELPNQLEIAAGIRQ
jgi:hypothetical protein